jgi:hypothetical protein
LFIFCYLSCFCLCFYMGNPMGLRILHVA